MRRKGTAAVLAGLAVILATAALASAQPRPKEKVTFQFAWIPYGKYAGFYMAKELGYYDEAGIDVTFIRGHGATDSLKTLAAGTAHLGEINQFGSVGGRARGVPVREVLMYHDKAMEVFYCLDKHGIKKPKDLEGKSIGGPVGAGARTLFPAFAAIHGIDPAKVTFVDMTPDAMVPAVITGRVHCASNFITERPTYQKAAAQAGEKLSGVVYSEWGLDLHANSIVATDETIKTRPDMIRRFLQATVRGWLAGIERPEDAVRAFHKHYPEANVDLLREHWKIAVEHMLTPPAYEHGLGWIDPARKKRTIDVYTKSLALPREVTLDEMMTNEFNPKIKPPRR
jgi:NitT/TauT family transport system substrate-binding protein